MPTRYISPTGAGLRDGSSAANAGALADLPAFIDEAGPGGEVLLIADEGAYHYDAEINITAGGAPNADVTIRGIDSAGNPMAAEIVGSRADNWTPGQPQGVALFNLLSGADHLTFQDLTLRNIGDGAFRVGNDIQDLAIQHVDATNVNRFFRDQALEPATSATISGLVVKDVTVEGYSKGAFLLKYDTHDVLFEDVVGDSQGQDGALFVVGVQIAGTAHDIVLRQVEMNNNVGRADSNQYWNGDGFTTELENYNIRFVDTRASGNGDGGYDIKSQSTVLLRAFAEGNKHNYRIWSDTVTLEDSISLSPKKLGGTGGVSHVEFLEGASARLDNFQFSDSGAPSILFDMLNGQARLELINTSIPDVYADRIVSRRGSVIEVLPDSDVPQPNPTANDAPTWIAVAGGVLQENADPGTVAVTLTAQDPDQGDSHVYTITGGATDRFEIVGNQIVVKAGAVLDNDTRNLYGINVTVTDAAGLSHSQIVYIRLTDVIETGTDGDDVLAGGTGGDTLTGRLGNDTYWVNSARDKLVEQSAEGNDLAYVKISTYTLANYVDQMVFKGTGSFTGIGNSNNNTITGGGSGDWLDGAGGNDIIYGAAGADTLAGGTANDQLHGGSDGDTIRGGSGNDSLWGDSGDDLLFGGEGFDSLYGADGNDVLDGGGANDRMFGDRGNDTYIVNTSGDVVTEKAGQGNDWVQSAVSYTLGNYVEHLALTGTAATTGIGNTLNNQIIGSGADNVLAGGDGNDTLNGGAGNDRLVGGQGTDTYRFDLAGGRDTIQNADIGASPDRLIFGAGIGEDDLWFTKAGNNLVVTVLGSSDQVTLQDWYAASANRLDHFELADGTVLQASDVPDLVAAMAGSPPPPNLSALNDDQEQAVAAAIAANWQT